MKSQTDENNIELKQRLARVLRVPSNKTCADCPETRPTWISFIKPQQKFALGSKVLASFVCLECAALHRKLGTHICVVRSISHDQFEDKDVECAEYSGNEVVNEIFEGHLQKSTMDGINIKPDLGAENARRERFIRQKYVDLYFYRKRAHYQHISEVYKLMASVRKPLESSGGRSKASPTKPFRKKLKMFLNEDPLLESGRDTIGCSTTVGNTTSTSRTRSLTDRDDSERSDAPTKLSNNEGQSSKKRRSKRKKNPKKRTSQRKLKQLEDQTDPIFDMVFEGGIARIGESSTPQKQPSLKNLKEPMHIAGANNRDKNDLSGMILLFDEESFNSITEPHQRERRTSMDIETYGVDTTAFSSTKSTIEAYENQNHLLNAFSKKPLIKSTSEGSDSRDPRPNELRGDVRRCRGEIIDEITRKHERPNSPGLTGRKTLNREESIDSHKRGNITEKSNILSPVQAMTPLTAHLSKDAGRNLNRRDRNLKIPYLHPQPISPISVEGIISEGTSYGFGDHTVNCMSGTGESQEASYVAESVGTANGFRVIDSDTTQPLSGGSFTEKFKNKKEADVLIKSQSFTEMFKNKKEADVWIKSQDPDDGWDQADGSNYISKSNRSLRNSNKSLLKERSSKSIGNKSNVSVDQSVSRTHLQHSKSPKSVDYNSPPLKRSKKSSRSLTNRSIMSMSLDTPASRKKSRSPKSQGNFRSNSPSSKKVKKKKKIKSSKSFSNKSHSSVGNEKNAEQKKNRKPKSKEHSMDCDSWDSKKNRTPKRQARNKSKKSRSRSKSSNRMEDINRRRQALLDEWEKLKEENQREFERLKRENQKKFADFDQHFSQHISLK